MAGPVFVLGGYQSDFAKVWSRAGQDISDIVRTTIVGTLDACDLDPSAIQSVHVGNAFGEIQRAQAHLGAMVSQTVPELNGIPAMRHEGACASSSLAILAAMSEIEAGRYDCILVLGVEELKNVPGDVASANQNAASWQGREDIDCRFVWPATFGLISREYEKRHGLDRRFLGRIADINYANAKRNPNAQTRSWQFRPENFMEDDEHNPIIEPGTRRYDCGQITDGGCGVVLASAEFAEAYAHSRERDMSDLAIIAGWGHRNEGLRLFDKLERSHGQDYVLPNVRNTILDAWRRAGIEGHEQLDLIETHDCFTTTEYLAIDHFGITPPGQSWQAIDSGDIEMDGRIPVNPSGGLIGVGHPVGATGCRMMLDVFRQVTETAGDCQIGGARSAATLNIGGSCATVTSFVVRSASSHS